MATGGLQNQRNSEGTTSDCQLLTTVEFFTAQPGNDLIARLWDFARTLVNQNFPDRWGVAEDVVAVGKHFLLFALPWFVHDLCPVAGDGFVFVVFFIAGDPVASGAPFAAIPVTETVFHVLEDFRICEN